MSIKVAQEWFHNKNDRFWHFYKNCLRLWDIWAKQLLPKAVKSCPKFNKSPNLVTLHGALNSDRLASRIACCDPSDPIFKKWVNPGLFFVFSNTHYNFYNKYICEKCRSSIRCWDLNSWPLEHESSPITTSPGLSPSDPIFTCANPSLIWGEEKSSSFKKWTTDWAVVVAQLVGQFLRTPETRGLNPVIGMF